METTYELPENRVLKIIQDNQGCTESPRDWDNVCNMIFFGNYSRLGDKHSINSNDYNSFEELEEVIYKEYNVAHIQKVYGYSHSGVTISLSPFSCPWDSGVLGFVIMTKESLRENYGVKNVTKKLIDKAMIHVKGEVKTLDQYISGDIYGFQVVDKDDEDNVIDSCWGFFGSNIKENGILHHLMLADQLHVEKLMQ